MIEEEKYLTGCRFNATNRRYPFAGIDLGREVTVVKTFKSGRYIIKRPAYVGWASRISTAMYPTEYFGVIINPEGYVEKAFRGQFGRAFRQGLRDMELLMNPVGKTATHLQ